MAVSLATNVYHVQEAKAVVQVAPPFNDGDLIQDSVILKPNIPTTEEEIKQVKEIVAAEIKAKEVKAKATVKQVKLKKVPATKKKACEPQCVTYAKAMVGVQGTWGDGGRKLSLNSDGDVGDVVIFKRIHVGVVVERIGNRRWVAESNYDFKCNIRIRELKNSEVRGYHKF